MNRLFNPSVLFLLVVCVFSILKIQESEMGRLESATIKLDNRIILQVYTTLDRLKNKNQLRGYLIVEHSELLNKMDTMRTNYQ